MTHAENSKEEKSQEENSKELHLTLRFFEKISCTQEYEEIIKTCQEEVKQLFSPQFCSLKPQKDIAKFTPLEARVYKSGVADVSSNPVCLPIGAHDQIFAVLTITDAETPHRYTNDDLNLMRAMATITGIALQNACFLKEKIDHERINSTLSRYMAPQVVKTIVSSNTASLFPLEKRNVTVLFTDIRNFSSLCERESPEGLVANLNMYFTYLVDILFNAQGTLDKYLGDGLVALFNAPTAVEKHEERAVTAAIVIQLCLDTIPNPQIRSLFKTGIGINSGEVIVGNIGTPTRLDYTAIGATVNIAKRLESMALGGQILVSSSVYEQTKELFTYKRRQNIMIKGKEEPIDVYEVIYR